MSWPVYPADWNSYYGDGESYGDELGRVSPQGNIWGQERRIREVKRYYWWTGIEYKEFDVENQAASFAILPAGPRPFGELWRVPKQHPSPNEWDYYYWDPETEAWARIRWYWTVDALSKLPYPGKRIGAAHIVLQTGQKAWWNGFNWGPATKHSTLENDERELHLPPGFMELLTSDVQIVRQSRRQITMEVSPGGSGEAYVNGERITAGFDTTLFHHLPALAWDAEAETVVAVYTEPDTEYWIYLANTQDTVFIVDAQPGDETHDPTPAWNFKGKLFLSTKPPENGYLAGTGSGVHARLAGKIQTDTTEMRPFFRPELDISLISRRASLPEAFRDYSDFRISFVDQNTLSLTRMDWRYGQIYVPEGLHYLGEGYDIDRTDPWVSVDADGDPSLETTGLSPNTIYYIYLPASVDAFNFNDVNPATDRPWGPDDEGAASSYDEAWDFRLRPFLSPSPPEHGRLTETDPGFWTRYVGKVAVDDNSRFVPAFDLSEIGPPLFDTSDMSGLAEVSFYAESDTSFKFEKKRGTSGIVIVGGERILTYERNDIRCLRIQNTDPVYSYDESDLVAPLTEEDSIDLHPDETLYLYLANSRSFWGAVAEKLFVTTVSPTQGYLSRNWPGNQARWMGTFTVDLNGKFTGSYMREGVSQGGVTIDDTIVSTGSTWSSLKISAALNQLQIQIDLNSFLVSEQSTGIPAVLEKVSNSQLRFRPLSGDTVSVVFPDLSVRDIPVAGISFTVTGDDATLYYVYMTDTDFYVSPTAPDAAYANMQTLGNDILVGYCAFVSGYLQGNQSVFSFWNQPEQIWEVQIPYNWPEPPYLAAADLIWNAGDSHHELQTTELALPGLVVPPGIQTTAWRDGVTRIHWSWYIYYGQCEVEVQLGTSYCSMFYNVDRAHGYVTASVDQTFPLASGVYQSISLVEDIQKIPWNTDDKTTYAWRITDPGKFYLYRNSREAS